MSKDRCLLVPPVPTESTCSVDFIANADICQRLRRAIPHQYRSFAVRTVHARMLASPIRIDRLAESDVGRVVAADDRARRLGGDRGFELVRRLFLFVPAVALELFGQLVEASGWV